MTLRFRVFTGFLFKIDIGVVIQMRERESTGVR